MDVSLGAEGAIKPEAGSWNKIVPGHIVDGLSHGIEGEERLNQLEKGGHGAWVNSTKDDDRLASQRLECQINGVLAEE